MKASSLIFTEVTVGPAVPGGTETILLAEDDEGLLKLANDVLGQLGYTVLLANDGEEAVQMYTKNRERIDLLLLDVMMPRMGGPEAFEKMRQIGGTIPLIFMTGYSSDLVKSRFVKQNFSIEVLGADVIQKPYNIDKLGRNVREVLDASRAKVIPVEV